MTPPIVSIYKNTTDSIGQPVSLFSVLRAIRSGRWKSQIEAVRNSSKAAALKKKLPAFTASGFFSPTRAAANLKQHSGYIAIDIDAKDNEHLSAIDLQERVHALSYVRFVSFISKSAGGRGYFVIFRINSEQHDVAYENISARLKKYFDIISDNSCKDVSRLRYVSYDAEAFLNENAEQLLLLPKVLDIAPKLRQNFPAIETEYQRQYEDIAYIAKRCKSQNLSILESYSDWYIAAQSLADVFGENGRQLLHELSATSAKYKQHDTDIQFNNCLKRKNTTGSLGFIFNQAARYGIIVKERYYEIKQPSKRLSLTTATTEKEPQPAQSEATKIAQLQKMLDLEFIAYNGEKLQHNVIQSKINAVYGCDLTGRQPENFTLPIELIEPPF